MSESILFDADLDDLRRAANRLYRRRPCRQRANCIARERERALNPIERDFCRWTTRPYGAYDHNRMCDACAAFWYAEMAARTFEAIAAEATTAEQARQLPQKG